MAAVLEDAALELRGVRRKRGLPTGFPSTSCSGFYRSSSAAYAFWTSSSSSARTTSEVGRDGRTWAPWCSTSSGQVASWAL